MSKRIAVVGRITKRNGKVIESKTLTPTYTGIAWGRGNNG